MRSNPDTSTGCFVVLGTPRGGTSVVAGLLRLAGLPMGELIDETNQEDLEFLDIGTHLRSPRTTDIGFNNVVVAEQRFRNLHDLRFTCHGAWGFKDPTLIDYLSDVIQNINTLRLICVFRDPVAVALREEMAGHSFDAMLRLTLARQARIVALVDSWDLPTLFVSYEKLLLRPWESFGIMSQFVTGAIDDSLREVVESYVVPECETASIENFDRESLVSF